MFQREQKFLRPRKHTTAISRGACTNKRDWPTHRQHGCHVVGRRGDSLSRALGSMARRQTASGWQPSGAGGRLRMPTAHRHPAVAANYTEGNGASSCSTRSSEASGRAFQRTRPKDVPHLSSVFSLACPPPPTTTHLPLGKSH